jgi:threonine dehydrogenase-like Zn-dependent dehydrogenase
VLADSLAVAIHAVRRAGFTGSGTALVLGAGTIGLCVARVLKQEHPRAQVVVSAAWPHQETAVAAAGAIAVGPRRREVVETVARLTESDLMRPWRGDPWVFQGGVEIVIDAVGTAASTETALRAVAPRGRVVKVGVGAAGRLESTLAYFKEVSIIGSNGYSGRQFDEALLMLSSAEVPCRSWLTHSFRLSQWRRAFEAAARPGRSGAIKVTLRPGA